MDFIMLLVLRCVLSDQINFWHNPVVVIKDIDLITECFLNEGDPMTMNYTRITVLLRHTVTGFESKF